MRDETRDRREVLDPALASSPELATADIDALQVWAAATAVASGSPSEARMSRISSSSPSSASGSA